MRVRMVDIESDRYKIARRYMLRLRRDDFEDPRGAQRLRRRRTSRPEQFVAALGFLAEGEPVPMTMRGYSRAPGPVIEKS